MRAVEINDHLNIALSARGQAERRANLLGLYVTCPPELRDTLFADVAYRLSFYDDALTDPSTPQRQAEAYGDFSFGSRDLRAWVRAAWALRPSPAQRRGS